MGQSFADRLEASRRVREARIASGEEAVRQLSRKLNFAIWGLSRQNAVSDQSAALGEKILGLVTEARTLVAAGQPDTMPDAAWDTFREAIAVGESRAQRHITAWQQMQAYAARATGQPAGTVAITRGTTTAITSQPSHLGRNLTIAAVVAALLGGGYWAWQRSRRREK